MSLEELGKAIEDVRRDRRKGILADARCFAERAKVDAKRLIDLNVDFELFQRLVAVSRALSRNRASSANVEELRIRRDEASAEAASIATNNRARPRAIISAFE